MFKLVTGNLLEAKVDALVNTVNTEGVMGKGLALQFKKAFPQNAKAYEAACKKGLVKIGAMFVVQVGGLVELPRYVINFPTKRHWRGASKVEYVEDGLRTLVDEIRSRNIRSIAVPPLGAGLGRLAWSDVLPKIRAALEPLEGVEVLVFEPAGAPEPASMPNRTKKPAMTPGRAAVIALMNRYTIPEYDEPTTVLEVQKLAYLLQEAGQPLRLTFKPHVFGPYADNLRHVLTHIEGHYLEGFGDAQNKPDTPLRLLPGAAEEAEAFLAQDAPTQARLERVARLIEGFETAFGMELLSTVHWVATRNAQAAPESGVVVRAVHAWNDRKASTMRPPQIEAALERLLELGWVPGRGGPAEASAG